MNLVHLGLSNKSFSGRIPPHLGNLSKLQYLDLSANYLSGHVPSEIGMLADLNFLDLSFNELSGDITEKHFAGLAKLKYLNLYGIL